MIGKRQYLEGGNFVKAATAAGSSAYAREGRVHARAAREEIRRASWCICAVYVYYEGLWNVVLGGVKRGLRACAISAPWCGWAIGMPIYRYLRTCGVIQESPSLSVQRAR